MATPTSRTSRQKIMAVNDRWLRRTSLSSSSGAMFSRRGDWVCQACLKSSGFMRVVLHQLAQSFLRAIELHPYVGFGNAQHLSDLAIGQIVQEEEDKRGIGLGQLANRRIEPLDQFALAEFLSTIRAGCGWV